MYAALATVAGWLTSLLTASVARYLAYKAVAITLFVVILPIVLNNFMYKLIEMFMNFVNSNSQDTTFISSLTLNLTGMLAYVVDSLSLPECLSIVMSAVALKFTLSFFSLKNLWLMR